VRTEGLFSSQNIETNTAGAEVTSEAKEYPVESALVSEEMRGWLAATSGCSNHLATVETIRTGVS
jgi:hypothetical protein